MIFPSKYNVYVQCSPVNLGATSFEKPNYKEIIEKEHQNLRETCMRHDIYIVEKKIFCSPFKRKLFYTMEQLNI